MGWMHRWWGGLKTGWTLGWSVAWRQGRTQWLSGYTRTNTGPILFYIFICCKWWGKGQIWWWQITGRSGSYTRGWCCHPEGPHKLEQRAGRGPHAVQQKCKVLHLGRNNPRHQDRSDHNCLEKQLCRKGPGSLGGSPGWTRSGSVVKMLMVFWGALGVLPAGWREVILPFTQHQ